MMRRALAGTVLVALAAAGPVLAGGINGTWSGRFIQAAQPYPPGGTPATLVVGPASITAQFSGKTIATHDPQTATSTCVMRFRFIPALSSDGWRVYQSFGKIVLNGSVSGGPPEGAPCGDDHPGSHFMLRVRPAGAKLKVEIGDCCGKNMPPVFNLNPDRAYLHH